MLLSTDNLTLVHIHKYEQLGYDVEVDGDNPGYVSIIKRPVSAPVSIPTPTPVPTHS